MVQNFAHYDCVADANYCVNLSANRFIGASPQVGEVQRRLDFFDCPVLFARVRAQVEPLDRFYALWLKGSVSAQLGSAFWS